MLVKQRIVRRQMLHGRTEFLLELLMALLAHPARLDRRHHIPGTVKLLLSPRQSRGDSQWNRNLNSNRRSQGAVPSGYAVSTATLNPFWQNAVL